MITITTILLIVQRTNPQSSKKFYVISNINEWLVKTIY